MWYSSIGGGNYCRSDCDIAEDDASENDKTILVVDEIPILSNFVVVFFSFRSNS